MNNPDLRALMMLPWTVVAEKSAFGDYTVLRIRELPEFVVSGTGADLATGFWDALESLMASYVDAGEPLPRPGPIDEMFRLRDALVSAAARQRQAALSPAASVTLSSAQPQLQPA